MLGGERRDGDGAARGRAEPGLPVPAGRTGARRGGVLRHAGLLRTCRRRAGAVRRAALAGVRGEAGQLRLRLQDDVRRAAEAAGRRGVRCEAARVADALGRDLRGPAGARGASAPAGPRAATWSSSRASRPTAAGACWSWTRSGSVRRSATCEGELDEGFWLPYDEYAAGLGRPRPLGRLLRDPQAHRADGKLLKESVYVQEPGRGVMGRVRVGCHAVTAAFLLAMPVRAQDRFPEWILGRGKAGPGMAAKINFWALLARAAAAEPAKESAVPAEPPPGEARQPENQ